ncbi:MAG: dienelactone hydrolase family protein [Proteobacteria bacterium]|nr:dienelactone hydrolase family protein [Pseudomonadota bacterium]
MNSLKQLNGPIIPPQSGTAKQMIMFLHGYGSDGNDLISIGTEWEQALPDTVFISPHAPEPCEQAPMGYQWFSIRAIDRAVFEREKQAEKVTPVLNAFIDAQLKQWNIDESHLAVVGFSQGAMMAMYAMPRRQKACAAVIGYSGMLIDAQGLKNPGIVKPPVLAIHGDADDVVPPSCLAEVQSGFSAAGFKVETILRPRLGHGIDQFGLSRGIQFIQEALRK